MSLDPTSVKDSAQIVSELPVDKIVAVFEGSFNVASQPTYGGYLKRFTLPHGFTRPLFTKLQWSTTGTNYIDGGFSYETGDPSRTPSTSTSDSTNVYIVTGKTTGTLYYKLICFWIDDYDTTNPLVPSYIRDTPSSKINFDSRLNYQKIWLQGIQNVTIPAFSSIDIPITHDLGYIPNVRVFVESLSGEVWPANFGGAFNYFLWDFSNHVEVRVQTYSTYMNLFTYSYTASTRRIWYRIYVDA